MTQYTPASPPGPGPCGVLQTNFYLCIWTVAMAEKRRILLFAVTAAVSLVVFSEAFPTTAFTKLGLKGSHEALSSLFHAARELDM